MTEGWLERAIGEAVRRGEFDDLPGAGRPIEGLARGYDPSWWAKGFVTRERAREAGIALMSDIDRDLPALLAGFELDEVLERVERWNAELSRINAELDTSDRFGMLHGDEITDRWKAVRR